VTSFIDVGGSLLAPHLGSSPPDTAPAWLGMDPYPREYSADFYYDQSFSIGSFSRAWLAWQVFRTFPCLLDPRKQLPPSSIRLRSNIGKQRRCAYL
jgi:hypothetical protein